MASWLGTSRPACRLLPAAWALALALLVAAAACGGGSHATAAVRPAAHTSGGPTAGAAGHPSAAPTAGPGPGASPPAAGAPGVAGSPAPVAAASTPPAPSGLGSTGSGVAWPIYSRGQHGYDVSYPQCPATEVPAGAAFSVIGVNGGRAFTTNPCLTTEWQGARLPRAMYLNSGYLAANATRVTADCQQLSQYQALSASGRTAYAIGCSESQDAFAAVRAAGGGSVLMVWIDVEAANSWEPSALDLNRIALQAEIDQLEAAGRLVGIYSTFSDWQTIFGTWTPDGIVADWVAGQSPDVACAAPGFTGHPVWLAQAATWPGSGFDSDWAC